MCSESNQTGFNAVDSLILLDSPYAATVQLIIDNYSVSLNKNFSLFFVVNVKHNYFAKSFSIDVGKIINYCFLHVIVVNDNF